MPEETRTEESRQPRPPLPESDAPPSSPPPAPEPPVLPKNVQEAVAFALLGESESVQRSQEEIRDLWQHDPDERAKYREAAERLAKLLGAVGVKISSSNAAKLEKHIEFIRTIPARTLED